MLSTKLRTIVEAKESLQNLASMELPLKTSYKLAKMVRCISNELLVFDEQRLKLCQKYGALCKNGNSYEIPPDKMPLFGKDYAELLNIDVELDCEKVTLPDTINIKPIDLVALYDFIEIEGD